MAQERIDRRTFLKITTICCAAGSLPGCNEVPIPGPVLPTSSTASLDLQRWVQAAQVQNCPLWCWAASASMIIGYNGFSVSQERIVRDTYGSLICTTGTSTQIAASLSRPYIDDVGRRFSTLITAAYDAFAGIRAISNTFIIGELRAGRPLIYCNRSHAMVLNSITYQGSASAPQVISASVIDPWPTAPRIRILSQSELVAVDIGGDMTMVASVLVR